MSKYEALGGTSQRTEREEDGTFNNIVLADY